MTKCFESFWTELPIFRFYFCRCFWGCWFCRVFSCYVYYTTQGPPVKSTS